MLWLLWRMEIISMNSFKNFSKWVVRRKKIYGERLTIFTSQHKIWIHKGEYKAGFTLIWLRMWFSWFNFIFWRVKILSYFFIVWGAGEVIGSDLGEKRGIFPVFWFWVWLFPTFKKWRFLKARRVLKNSSREKISFPLQEIIIEEL